MSTLRSRADWVKDHAGPIAKTYAAEIRWTAPDTTRTRTFVITTDSPDRERDIIAADGWQLDNYLKNPVVLFGHDYKSPPIGKALTVRRVAHGLEADVEFAPKEVYPFAETILGLVDFGALKATSVGFDPIKWHANEGRRGYDFLEQELLEFSIVPVPANAEALQLALKGLGGERFGLYRDWITAAHAALVEVLPDAEQPPEGFASLDVFLAETVLRPYPNEHACRLADPGQFSQFRRGSRSSGGKTLSVIYGKKGTTWSEQAYRYGTDSWTAAEARGHCGKHDGTFEAASKDAADAPTPETPAPEALEVVADTLDLDVSVLLPPAEAAFTPEDFKSWLRDAVGGVVDTKIAARMRQLTGRLD